MNTIPNRSTAVMARRDEPADSLDDFPTPPWAVRALMERLAPNIEICSVWEPACGRGHMARTLWERFGTVYASDIHDYGYTADVGDFLKSHLWPQPLGKQPDWIITNPPFRLAEQFAHRALEVSQHGVALLCRLQWLEGKARYRLFKAYPPAEICVFSERVPMVKGRLDPKASSATAYAWFVWHHSAPAPELHWIPPGTRKRLERPEDYQ